MPSSPPQPKSPLHPKHKPQPRLPTSSTLPLLFRGAARKPALKDLSTVYKQSSPNQAQAQVRRPKSRAQHIPIPHVSNDRHQRALRGEIGEKEDNVRESWGLQRAREAGIVRGRIGGMDGGIERKRGKGKGQEREKIEEEGGIELRERGEVLGSESGAQNRDSDPDPIAETKYTYTPEQQHIRNETDTETSETQLAKQLEQHLGPRAGDASETSKTPLSPKAKKEKRRTVSVRHVPLSGFLPEMGVRDEQWLQNLSEPTELVDLKAIVGPEDRGSEAEDEEWREREKVEGKLAVEEKKVEDTEIEKAKVGIKGVEAMENDNGERETNDEDKNILKKELEKCARRSAEAAPSSPLKKLQQDASAELHIDKDLPPLPAIPRDSYGSRTESGEMGSGPNVNKTLPPTPLASSPASGRLVWGFDDGEMVEDAELRRTSQGKQGQQGDELYTCIQALTVKIKEDRGAQCRSLASDGPEDVRVEANEEIEDFDEEDADQDFIEKRTENSIGDKEVGKEVRLFRPTSLRVLEVANSVDPGTIPYSDLEEPVDREGNVDEDVPLGKEVAQNHRERSSNKDSVVEEGDVLQEIIDESNDGRDTEELLEDTTEETHEASLACTKTTSSNDEEKENPPETHDQGSRQFNGVSPETLEKVKAATEKLKAILREREQEQHGSIRQQKPATAATEEPRQVVTEKDASRSEEERDTVKSESGVAAEQSSPENDIWAASTEGEDDEAKLLRRVVMNYA